MAHLHPQGWSHGGHDEQAMARIDARLTREIREAGGAGAIIFAWLDEWFKKNWLVIDVEIPRDHTRRWHNVMDAEQHYGILGQYAGRADLTPRLGGDPARWRALPVVQRAATPPENGLRALRAGADESFYYLAVELATGLFAWDTLGLQLAIDTYLPSRGQHRLPGSGVRSELGFEFLVDLTSPDSGTIRVTPDYNRHDSRVHRVTGDDAGRFYRRPVVTLDRHDGRFDPLLVITNRGRFGRDGRFFPAKVHDRGRLLYGTEAGSTLSDWYLDQAAGLLELRIPWDLLNVTDPSTRTLLFDRGTAGGFGTVPAEDFRVGVVAYRKGGRPAVVGALPELEAEVWRAKDFTKWRWAGWTEPRSHARLKPVYDSLRSVWNPAGAPTRPAPRAP
jgi:hypothetical protein